VISSLRPVRSLYCIVMASPSSFLKLSRVSIVLFLKVGLFKGCGIRVYKRVVRPVCVLYIDMFSGFFGKGVIVIFV